MGCKGEVVDEYTTHIASFRFDFQYGHTQSYLYPALNSTNYFCFFSTKPIEGGYDLITEAYGTKEKNVEHITSLQDVLLFRMESFMSLTDNVLTVSTRQVPRIFP